MARAENDLKSYIGLLYGNLSLGLLAGKQVYRAVEQQEPIYKKQLGHYIQSGSRHRGSFKEKVVEQFISLGHINRTVIDNSIDESLSDTNNQSGQIINNETSNQQGQSYINGLQQIDLTQTPDSQAAQIVNGVNSMIYKTQSFIVQIIAYALTIMLTLRTLFDLTYIAIPFSRSLIDRISGQPGGNMSNIGGNMMNQGQSFGGQDGQFNQPPAASGTSATGSTSGATRVQLISDEARAAIQSPRVFRTYAKSMAVTLIATTVMLVLALTGALTDLGFIIGKALAAALGKVKII